jgi:protein O-GlcNAc transferase
MTIPQAFQIAVQHHQAGRLADAEAYYRRILAAQPNHAGALHLLGLIAHQVGRHELAVDLIRQSIALNPNNAIAHSNLGDTYRTIGRFDEAAAACRRALQIKPDSSEAHNNLGNALKDLGRPDEAMAAYRRALQVEPDMPEAHLNLGNVLKDLGRLEEAMAACHRALELKPGCAEAHLNLGNVLRDLGRLDEAAAAYRCALQVKPDLPEAHHNLGNALKDLGQLDEAIAALRRAIELRPDYAEAHNSLGAAFKDLGQLDEAIAAFRLALESNPQRPEVQSNVVYTLHFHPGHNARSISEETRLWNRRFSEPLKRFALPDAGAHGLKRPLRVGYVSPDFRDHVVGRNLLPLFRNHDRRDFEILCYAGVVRPDKLTEEFRQRTHLWRSTVGVSDEALAEMIRRDGVDILVDLTQHMAGNRLPVFARQPAPIQVSFAGYPDSSGVEAIGYRISDRYLEAGAMEEHAGRQEQVCLIDSFWCYDSQGNEVEVSGVPAGKSGLVTFGNLGNFCKVSNLTLKLWARVLGAVKASRLVIRSAAGSHRQRILEALGREGVEAQRVDFVAPRPQREYLELYHRLDIILDTFPYNGHTTSLDALWMGVPVVSMAGETPVSRGGLSQLSNLGLPELVARSDMEYVNIAEKLAKDLPRLVELRSTLRARLKASVLMDAPGFARNIEAAYRFIFQEWRDKQYSVRDDR